MFIDNVSSLATKTIAEIDQDTELKVSCNLPLFTDKSQEANKA